MQNKKIKKKREEQKQSNFKNINFKTLQKLSVFILVANYHNYHFYHLWTDPDKNLKNKNRC